MGKSEWSNNSTLVILQTLSNNLEHGYPFFQIQRPAAACRFPFKAGGSEYNECARVDYKKVKGHFKNERDEEGDSMSGRCKAMHKHYRKKKEDEKLWEDVDFVKLVGKEGKRITNCYK